MIQLEAMRVRKSVYLSAMMAMILLSGCANRELVDELHLAGCAPTPAGASAWHITRLYDCQSRSLYVPYQLWTGAQWDGDRSKACMHEAHTKFLVDGDDATTIRGPIKWKHPSTGETLDTWHRNKDDGRKQQIFTCHANGIGRVFDSRRSRVYAPGRCKFPAGPGWSLFNRRHCDNTSIEIFRLELSDTNDLAALHFRWWFDGTLDHKYRYAPGKSMTSATRLR